jgi:hypothetical protein
MYHTYIHTYVCMFVCMYVCMYVIRMYVYIRMYVCVYVCIRTYVCMYVCIIRIYVCMYVYTYIHIASSLTHPYHILRPRRSVCFVFVRLPVFLIKFCFMREDILYITSSSLCLLGDFTSCLNFGSRERVSKGPPL